MEILRTAFISALLFTITITSSAQAQENASLEGKLSPVTDLVVPAGAISLQLQRRLQSGQRGSLGLRWRLNWESRLSRTSRLVQIEDWTGVVSFNQTGQQLEYTNSSGEQIAFTSDGRALRRTSNDILETFDSEGRLIERTYHHGNKILLRYDPQGRLWRVEGPGGSFLQFTADGTGRVIQVEGSTGGTVRYSYEKDDLIEASVNGGLPLRYGYDAKGCVVRFEDPQTGALEIAYDAKGRVVSYRRVDGGEQRFEFDDATNTSRIIEPNRATTVTRESPEKLRTEVTDPLGNKSAIQFDQSGRPVIITGPNGASARMSYDSSGRLIAAEDPLGHMTRYEYAGNSSTPKAIIKSDGARQEFVYDDHDNLTAIRIGGKVVGALTYNPDGSIATVREPGAKEQRFTYYPNGLLKSGANALGETTQFEYDARGNLIRETNPLGGVSVRNYDSQDRLVGLANAAGGTTRYEYDYRGRLSRETNSAGGVTRFDYDSRGRLAAETNPFGQVTRYEYSPVDKLIKTTWPDSTFETYSYDLAGNLIERTDRLGRTFRFERDPLGRVSRERWPSGLEVRYRYDAAGNLLAVEDSVGTRNGYQTDILRLSTTKINPAGGKTQYQYDPLGNLVAVTDTLGRVKQFRYTADGDLIQAAEPSGDEARYEYDAAGRIIAIRRPSGGITRYTYDRMGNVLTVTDPLGNVKRFSYDNAGRLITFIDAATKVTRYVYDKAGQRIEKQLPDGKRIAYKYDVLGRMIGADDGAFPVRMVYDLAGNLKQVEYAAINKSVSYEYDSQGLRTKMMGPDGRGTRYEYDALKRLSAIILPDEKRVTIGYEEKNRIRSVVYPNGITGRWVYDAGGQIATISYQDNSGKPIARSSYRYDAAGNPVERQDAQGQTSHFAYDPAGQLIEETNPETTIRYAYAAGGNRATVTEATSVRHYKHDAADRLIEAGTEKLSYDVNGNLIGRKGLSGSTAYEYDAENRLIKVVADDGATTAFGYAPTGERVWRRDKSGVTYFLYDGINLIAELASDLRTKTTYVHGFGIDRPLAMLQGNQSYYYHGDRVGSITHLTDDNGKVAAAYSYDAFGKIKSKQGTVATPFAFTGREMDPTGLYYFRARYYDAAIGRFISNDLISAKLDEPLEQNSYLYVRNNPVRFVDPLGLDYFTPEYLQGQSNEDLYILYKIMNSRNKAAADQVFNLLRGRGLTTPELETYHANPKGLPPWYEAESQPGSQSNPRTPGVGAGGSANTGAVNGGSPNRPGANTQAVRPQPGPPGSNTQQGGNAPPGGNTVRTPTSEQGVLQRILSGRGVFNVDPNGFWKVQPGISGAGTAATLIAAAVDCYRNPDNCSKENIARGVGIAIAARVLLGSAAAPVGTIIAGAIAWKKVGTELAQGKADEKQRKEQEDARKAQEQANLKNRDSFYPRIEQLRGRINALKKDHDIVTRNLPKAAEQAEIAQNAATAAQEKLESLRTLKKNRDTFFLSVCNEINSIKPATLIAEIDGLAAQAEAGQAEIDRLLNEGRQLAANCGSAADAQAIRDRYNKIKSLLQQIVQLKKTADQKSAALDKIRPLIEQLKGQLLATISTDIADKWLDADNAAKEATRLITQVRDSILILESGKKLRREIDALHSAVPEALLADIQDQFNGLQGLLSSVTDYPSLVRYDDQAVEAAKLANTRKDEALRILEGWKVDLPCQTEIPSTDAAIQRINTALAMAGLSDAAGLLHQAQACEASAKCIPVINQARQMLEQLQIESGEAAINQARQAGCNVEGLINALDYYRTIRDAASLLNGARQQCKFQDAMTFVEKIPKSIQNNPAIGNAIAEIRAGGQAQEQVEQAITSATNAAVEGSDLWRRFPQKRAEIDKYFANADSFVAQADRIAVAYPCLVDRVNKYKGEYNKLKASAGWMDPNQPADEVPDALDPGKSREQPTDEVPGALDPVKPQSKPTSEVPGALDPGKGRSQPTDEVPGTLGPGNPQPPVSNNRGDQSRDKKESKPKDPNRPGKAETIGKLIGAIGGAVLTEIQKQKTNEGGSPSGSGGNTSRPGGSGGTTGGGRTGRSGGTSTGSGGGAPGSSGGATGSSGNTSTGRELPEVDYGLRGDWRGTDTTNSCPVNWEFFLSKYDTPMNWGGVIKAKHNCPEHTPNGPNFTSHPRLFGGTGGGIEVTITGPGQLRASMRGDNGTVYINGTFTDTRKLLQAQITLSVGGRSVTFTRFKKE